MDQDWGGAGDDTCDLAEHKDCCTSWAGRAGVSSLLTLPRTKLSFSWPFAAK